MADATFALGLFDALSDGSGQSFRTDCPRGLDWSTVQSSLQTHAAYRIAWASSSDESEEAPDEAAAVGRPDKGKYDRRARFDRSISEAPRPPIATRSPQRATLRGRHPPASTYAQPQQAKEQYSRGGRRRRSCVPSSVHRGQRLPRWMLNGRSEGGEQVETIGMGASAASHEFVRDATAQMTLGEHPLVFGTRACFGLSRRGPRRP